MRPGRTSRGRTPGPRRAARGRAGRAGRGAGGPGRDPVRHPRRLGAGATSRSCAPAPRRSRSTRASHARGGRPPRRRLAAPWSCVAEDLDQVEKLRRVRGDIRTVRKVVLLDGDYPDRRVMTLRGPALAGRGRARPRPVARSPGASTRCGPTPWPPCSTRPARDRDARRRAAYACGVGRRGREAAEGAAEGLRHLSRPAPRHEGHALLAAQLVHGFGVCVDARAVGGVTPGTRAPDPRSTGLAGNLPA